MPDPAPPRLARPVGERLLLRPSGPADAVQAFAIQSDWDVTRMLRMARFPPDRGEIADWFADHPRQWAAGEAYRFAVDCDGRMIGLADLDEIRDGAADLGYWFERSAWGRGHASAVGDALVRFAFAGLGLARLRSAHATDNPASGRVLVKLGFQPVDTVQVASRSRGAEILQTRYVFDRLYC
ncbi:MAG TPA: GNAT family N-acetyltransferase [Dongiaceae bacterium]|nr:GNAT family N-acetyltransferase [Dongiaceae bacterium]